MVKYKLYDETDPKSIEKYGKKMIGKTLGEILNSNNEIVSEDFAIYNNAKHKGKVGHLIEKEYFGIERNSKQEPDFKEANVELKVSPKTENPIKLKDILEQCVDEKYYIKEGLEKWKILKGAKKIERTSKTGHKYIFSEGAISFPDNINLPARTMLTSESSVNRSSHIIKDPNTGRLRILTPIEAERIQGFEDDWTNKGMPEKFRYFCMGNALVVPMVTRMGNYLNKIIEAEL